LKYLGFDKISFIVPLITLEWAESHSGQLLALALFALLCIYFYRDSKKAA